MSATICTIKFEIKLWLEIKPSWLNLQIKKQHVNGNDNKILSLWRDSSSNSVSELFKFFFKFLQVYALKIKVDFNSTEEQVQLFYTISEHI